MQDEPRMSPDDPELATDLPWFTHGRATDDPEWATDEPRTYRTSHGRATDKPEWATDEHLPRIAPDVLNILKPPGSTPDPPESPRMYKDEPRTCHGPSGTSQGWPRIANRGSSGGQIRGSVTVALVTEIWHYVKLFTLIIIEIKYDKSNLQQW